MPECLSDQRAQTAGAWQRGGKRAIVAYTSDGTKFGSEIDFASGYLRHVLGFFGITDIEFVAADAMAFGAEDAIARGEAAVDALAA